MRWGELEERAPAVAAVGRALLYEHDIALGFLATVDAAGWPRVHPICPLLTGAALYGFIVPGPKLQDLRRDGRYALHCETYPPPREDDAFYVRGTAEELHDADLRQTLTEQFLAERGLDQPWAGWDDQALVEFGIDRCLVTLTSTRDGLPAGHTTWHDG